MRHGKGQHRPDSDAGRKTHWGLYIQELAGYRVVTSGMPNQHRGGVAIFYWKFMQFAVDKNQQHITNVVIFQLAMGDER